MWPDTGTRRTSSTSFQASGSPGHQWLAQSKTWPLPEECHRLPQHVVMSTVLIMPTSRSRPVCFLTCRTALCGGVCSGWCSFSGWPCSGAPHTCGAGWSPLRRCLPGCPSAQARGRFRDLFRGVQVYTDRSPGHAPVEEYIFHGQWWKPRTWNAGDLTSMRHLSSPPEH